MLIYFLAFIILCSTQGNSGYGTPPTPSSNHSNENIDHTKFLFEDIRNLYLSDRCSDVVLVVGNERLPAHRIILASRSEYFRRSFFGDYEEAHKSEVNLSDAVVITSFKILLKYIYTGQINLGDLEGEEVFELLRISDYFGISNLKLPLHEYLKSTINVENSWSFLAMTRIYKYNELEVESLDFIENNALGVLQSENFLSLSPEALRDILIRDSFFANELDIFRAVCRWIKKHQNDLDHDTEMKVLSAVRYPLMSINEAEADVRLSNGDYLINDHFLDSEISNLYLSDSCSDVVLVVDEERLPAHRIVLASRIKYFWGLFYGNYKESYKSEVNLSDNASVTTFKILLQYIYTDRINLSDLEGGEVFELLRISDFFCISNLKLPLHEYLKSAIDVENACSFLTMARIYRYNESIVEALNFIDNQAFGVLQSEHFLSLSPETLQDILIRDSFFAKELFIFRAVCRWIKKHQYDLDHDTEMKVLSAIRYPLMSIEELAEVGQSPFVKSNKSLHDTIFRNSSSPDKLQYRGQLKPNVDLIHRPDNFIFLRPSTTSVINGGNGCITRTLRDPSFINYIVISLSGGGRNEEPRYYSYYIDVSMDQNVWIRVIDHSNYNCRSTQRLWIKPRIVRYIRVVETNSIANATLNFLKVMYNTKEMHMVEIKNGLVVPKYRYKVTSRHMDPLIIKGENDSMRYTLLNNIFYHPEVFHDLNIYTYHYMRRGCIVIHLAQPYILSSMRLLLWGGDDQFYKYTIEGSVNNQDWKTIATESEELKQSWQVLTFTPRPILYIRITGLYSSTVNDFRIVYFEAPAQVTLDSNIIVDDREENNETDIMMTETSASNAVV